MAVGVPESALAEIVEREFLVKSSGFDHVRHVSC
jgi:hypothetical protein